MSISSPHTCLASITLHVYPLPPEEKSDAHAAGVTLPHETKIEPISCGNDNILNVAFIARRIKEDKFSKAVPGYSGFSAVTASAFIQARSQFLSATSTQIRFAFRCDGSCATTSQSKHGGPARAPLKTERPAPLCLRMRDHRECVEEVKYRSHAIFRP